MTTEKMKNAVSFCEDNLQVTFTGDIEDFNQVSNFLKKYLEQAKSSAIDVHLDYLASKYGCNI